MKYPTGIKIVPLPAKCVHCDPMVLVHRPRSGYNLDPGNPIFYSLSECKGEPLFEQVVPQALIGRSLSFFDLCLALCGYVRSRFIRSGQ